MFDILTIITFKIIFLIAALGHYLPLSINMLDLAIAGYMAIGAYGSAILTRNFGVPFGIALLLGGLLATVFALFIDYTAARVKLKGFSFAIVTISFAEITRVVLINLDYTGGSQGFRKIAPHTTLYTLLGILFLLILFLTLLNRSYLGRALGAIRDDEIAAEAMGINILMTKLFVGAVGAFIGGLSGGLYAHYALFLEPNQFGFDRLIEIQLPVVFGGLETFWGPIFGTTFLGLLPEVLRPLYNYRLISYAVLTIIVLILRPQGIITRQMVNTVSGFFILAYSTLAGWLRGREKELGMGIQEGSGGRGIVAKNFKYATPTTMAVLEPTSNSPVLIIQNVTRRFGGLDALHEVTIKVMPFHIHAIIGPNGAGKTTLFNIINGLLSLSQGKVYFKGKVLTGLRCDLIAGQGIGRTFQNVRIFKGLTVIENVQVGGHKQASVSYMRPFIRNPFKVLPEERRCYQNALALIDFVGLKHVAHRLAGMLPLAEQRKVELARALASDPEVLLLDEQTAGMNRSEKDELCDLVRKIVKMGKTVIFVEHDMRVVMGMADIVSVLSFGRIIAEGSPDQVRANPEVIEAYLGRE
jgi:branched-chain amino acid transport system permease protein